MAEEPTDGPAPQTDVDTQLALHSDAPASKRLKLESAAQELGPVLLEPVQLQGGAREDLQPATSGPELKAKQLEALRMLQSIYKAEYLGLLEHLKTTHQGFLASGHSMLEPEEGQQQTGRAPRAPAPSSMQAVLRAYRTHGSQPAAETVNPDAPPSPTRAHAVPGCSEASRGVGSLDNWMGQQGAPTSAGTPQSALRRDLPGATAQAAQGARPIGLTPVAEEPPSTPSTQGAGSQQAAAAGSAATPQGTAEPGPPGTGAGAREAAGQPASTPQQQQQQQQANGTAQQPTPAQQGTPAASTPVAAATGAAPMEVDEPQPDTAATGAAAAQQPAVSQELHTAGQKAGSTQAGGTGSSKPTLSLAVAGMGAECSTPMPAPAAGKQTPAQAATADGAATTAAAAGAPGGVDDELVSFSDAEEALVAVVGAVPTSQQQQQQPHRPGRFQACGQDKLLQLEALASAVTEQELDDMGALACLVAPKGRFLITQTTVLLGRSTETKGEVDVDLSQAGPSEQVSRRQAFLTLRPDGMWSLTNLGRRVVWVDGAAVPHMHAAPLQHLSLLEAGGLRLLLLVNSAAVERVLRRTMRAAV